MKIPIFVCMMVLGTPLVGGAEVAPASSSKSATAKDFTSKTIGAASIDEIKAWLKKDKKGCYLLSQFNILMSRPSTMAELDELFGKKSHDGVGGAFGWLVSDDIFIVDDVAPDSINRGDMLMLPFAYGYEGAWYLNHRLAGVHYSQLK